MTPEEIENIFTYHPPHQGQVISYTSIRDSGKELAMTILRNCPVSAERTLAIRKIQEAVMWANASIAINE